MAICFQKSMYLSPAEVCPPQVFDELTRSAQTKWLIVQHRLAKAATNGIQGGEFDTEEYRKFCMKEEAKKKAGAKFKALSEADKMKRYAAHLKESLPVFIFGAKEFDEKETASGKLWRRRCLDGVHLNGLFMFDVDHVKNPREIFEQTRVEGFPWKVVLAHITPSGEGLRLVCMARTEVGNIADNQIELAHALNVKADASCIDASRISFCPMAEEILYIDNENLFNYENREFYEKFNENYRMGNTDPTDDSHSFDDAAPNGAASADSDTDRPNLRSGAGHDREGAEVVTWRGYEIQKIIDCRYGDKLPCAADSNRHAESLKLATDLLILLDGDKAATQKVVEAQSWVQEIIAERNENVKQTVSSAADSMAKKEKEGVPWPSKAMQEAIHKATGKSYKEIIQGPSSLVSPPKLGGVRGGLNEGDRTTPAPPCQGGESRGMLPLEDWGRQIEELFPHFPLLELVCRGFRRENYPAVVFASGGMLATLMTRCWYYFYFDPDVKRRLNASVYVIGDPGTGKSFAEHLNKILMSPIKSADKAGIDAQNRFKTEKVEQAPSSKKDVKKPNAYFRIHPARTSNAQFIGDMENAKEVINGEDMHLHLYTFDSELDNTIANQKAGSWIDKANMELKAFHNEEDGQAYTNKDSVISNFNVYWNYVYTGTPIALAKKVTPKNFGSGLATRLSVIPLSRSLFQMAEKRQRGTTDWQRNEGLKSAAFDLDRRMGELPFDKLVDALYDWCARRMADAGEDNDLTKEMLLKRCPYHGINIGAGFIDHRHKESYKLSGPYTEASYETDEWDEKLVLLLTNIQFACQLHYFGTMADAYFDNMNNEANANIRKRHQATVDGYQRLPEVFSLEDVKAIFGYENIQTVYSKVKRLAGDKLAERIKEGKDKGKYRKTNALLISN